MIAKRVKIEEIKMDYEAIDKKMTFILHEIYADPKRHKFYSQFQAFEDSDVRGIRGGKKIGKKRRCYFCGAGFGWHAKEDERI